MKVVYSADPVILAKVGSRQKLPSYLKKAWKQKNFAYVMARSRIQAKNQSNRLGYFWLVLTPLIDAAVYGTVFGMLMGGNRPDNFVQFLIIGIFLFRVFTDCVSQGARSIINSQALVQTLSFPRIVLPLAVALESFMNFIPVLLVMLVLNIAMGAMPTFKWLWIVPILLLYALFNTGVVFVVARIATHFRDITQIIPFMNRIMRYFSGVFYHPAVFVGHLPLVMALFVLNPVFDFMELARWALIPDYAISQAVVISGVVWAFATFVLGGIFFWAAEERYGRVD